MARVQSWMLWVAGLLAILGSVGLVRLPLMLLFVSIDILTLIVGFLCFAAAYASREAEASNSVLNWALWITGGAAIVSLLPIVSLPIILPFVTVNGLMLIVGFICLLIAYLKS